MKAAPLKFETIQRPGAVLFRAKAPHGRYTVYHDPNNKGEKPVQFRYGGADAVTILLAYFHTMEDAEAAAERHHQAMSAVLAKHPRKKGEPLPKVLIPGVPAFRVASQGAERMDSRKIAKQLLTLAHEVTAGDRDPQGIRARQREQRQANAVAAVGKQVKAAHDALQGISHYLGDLPLAQRDAVHKAMAYVADALAWHQ